MIKDKIIEYFKRVILVFVVLVVIPIITFVVMSRIQPLDAGLYVTVSISGFCTACFLIWTEILNKSKSWKVSVTSFILLIGIFPLIGIYSFSFVSPVPVTMNQVAAGLFGYLFGACIRVSITLLLPKKELKN